MGWKAVDLPDTEWKLYTRNGTSSVYLKKPSFSEEIHIPSELLRELVASDVRSYKTGVLEQAEDNEILGLLS